MEEKVILGPVVIASLVFQISLKDEWHRVSPNFMFFFWYWSRDRGSKVSLQLRWLFWLNPRRWGQGEHLTIQVLRLFCISSSWVSTCVPDVAECSKDTAYVWTKGEPRGIFIGKSCFYNPVKHPRWSSSTKIVSGINRLTIFAKNTLPQMFGCIPKAAPVGIL